jgi:hypothetical protein
VQVELQPSPFVRLPSSHPSALTFRPSPQMAVQTVGCVPAQVQPTSTTHAAVQPSPLAVLPSSQPSFEAFLPSPQVELQTLGWLPEQV